MTGKEFVNPNLHVALIHFPIGLFVAGVLIEFFSFLGWRRSGFRTAGRYMILLGALSGIPTAFSGLYAFSDVVRQGLDETTASASWNEQLAESPLARDEHSWEHAKWHAYINGGATVLLSLVVVLWLGSSDAWRHRLHFPLLLLVLLGLAGLATGAWYGGEMVYRHGVGVEEGAAMGGNHAHAAQVEAQTTAPATGQASTVPAAELQTKIRQGLERYLPPLQTHLILAGVAVAIALAALGLTLRVSNSTAQMVVEPAPELSDLAVAYGARPVGEARPRDLDEFEGAPASMVTSRLPSARLWLLTTLVAVLTAGFGWWVMAEGYDTWNIRTLVDEVFGPARESPRRAAHVVTGGVIIIVPLILALFARVAPRQRILTLLFALLLIAAVAAQVWFGILLMWDSPDGPLDKLNV